MKQRKSESKVISIIREQRKEITLKKLIIIMLGAMILTFGVYNIHQQSSITEGGVLGMLVLIHHTFGISTSIIAPVLDIICYILAFRFLGTTFLILSGFTSAFVSMFYKIWEQNPPILPNYTDKPWIAAILGGIFVGIGVGLIVSQGGSSGGDDALVIMISKKTKWKLSTSYIITDTIVLLLSLTYIPWYKVLLSLASATLSSNLIDLVQSSIRKLDNCKKFKKIVETD